MGNLRLAVLGSSGSIGIQTLDVISSLPNITLSLIANHSDEKTLQSQIIKYHPLIAYSAGTGEIIDCVHEKTSSGKFEFLSRPETYADIDIVINGIAGMAGIYPSAAVLQAGKILATANKESIVCFGRNLKQLEKKYGGKIIPVDSEHSALMQCLDGGCCDVEKLIITASGGAFRDYSLDALAKAKAADALKHPNWKMGNKITIDCATMVNKGLELIEAARLFDTERVEAVMHRESILHGLVEFKDGSLKASLGSPDMRIPIQYALTYPNRVTSPAAKLDLCAIKSLSFEKISEDRFPALEVLKPLVSYGDFEGTVAVSADEILVKKYVENKIGYFDIAAYLKKTLDFFGFGKIDTIEDVTCIEYEVEEYILSLLASEGK